MLPPDHPQMASSLEILADLLQAQVKSTGMFQDLPKGKIVRKALWFHSVKLLIVCLHRAHIPHIHPPPQSTIDDAVEQLMKLTT